CGARCDDEHDADDRFLDLRPAPLGPGEERCREKRRAERRYLHRVARRWPAEVVGSDDAERGDLRDGKVDEDDAPLEHLHAERDVRRGDEQARDERGPQDAELGGTDAHFTVFSKRSIVSSNSPKRSFARSVPPTVKGSITLGILVLSDRNCAAPGLL